ncbi:hypothetical protein Slin14017_G126930 [Septoria linicola]|nr:hypothetical protein Slin14017_G126930 [Septoria linicola]
MLQNTGCQDYTPSPIENKAKATPAKKKRGRGVKASNEDDDDDESLTVIKVSPKGTTTLLKHIVGQKTPSKVQEDDGSVH